MTITISEWKQNEVDSDLYTLVVHSCENASVEKPAYISLFRLHARWGSWDVQTGDHWILAHGSADSIGHAKLQARNALGKILDLTLMELDK